MGKKLQRYKFKVDDQALAAAKMGTMEDLLWFAWYTLNDNLPDKSKGFNLEVAKDLINSINNYKGLVGRQISDWSESHCILVLDDLRKQKSMSWNQYDSYQKHFWSLLQIASECDFIEANPLNSWLHENTAYLLYQWKS